MVTQPQESHIGNSSIVCISVWEGNAVLKTATSSEFSSAPERCCSTAGCLQNVPHWILFSALFSQTGRDVLRLGFIAVVWDFIRWLSKVPFRRPLTSGRPSEWQCLKMDGCPGRSVWASRGCPRWGSAWCRVSRRRAEVMEETGTFHTPCSQPPGSPGWPYCLYLQNRLERDEWTNHLHQASGILTCPRQVPFLPKAPLADHCTDVCCHWAGTKSATGVKTGLFAYSRLGNTSSAKWSWVAGSSHGSQKPSLLHPHGLGPES